jgi:hypothetical protein
VRSLLLSQLCSEDRAGGRPERIGPFGGIGDSFAGEGGGDRRIGRGFGAQGATLPGRFVSFAAESANADRTQHKGRGARECAWPQSFQSTVVRLVSCFDVCNQFYVFLREIFAARPEGQI